MPTQEDIKRLEEGFRIAYEKGETEKAKAIGLEIRKLQKQLESAPPVKEIQQPQKPETKRTALDILKGAGTLTADIARSFAKGAVLDTAGILGLPGLAERKIESVLTPKPTEQEPDKKQPISDYFSLIRGLRSRVSPTPVGLPSPVRSLLGGYSPTGEQITQAIETLPGAKVITQYEPQTELGKYARIAGGYIAPTLPFTRPLDPGKLGRIGRAFGVGGVAALPTYGLQDYPITGAVLSAALGGATAFATGPSRASEAARLVLKETDPIKIELAKEIQEQALELGIPISAPELIDSKLLRSLGETVYGTEKGGTVMFNYLQNRPEKIKEVASDLLNQITKDPGSKRILKKEVSEAAEAAIKSARQTRKQKAQQWYKVANDEFIEESQVKQIINKIDETLAGLDRGDPTISKLKNLKKSLTKKSVSKKDQPEILDEFGMPIEGMQPEKVVIPQTNINMLDNVLKRFEDMVVDSSANIAKESRFIDKNARRLFTNQEGDGILDMLDDALRSNQNYATAKDVFKQLSDELVQPIIDNVAPLAKNNISMSNIKNFIFNFDENNVDDITKTYQILNKQDPTVFPKIVRTYINSVMEKKLIPTTRGEESLKSGFNLWKELTGKGANEKNFTAILKGVAEAQGKNPNNVVLGFQKFNNVLKNTAKIANVDNPRAAPSSQFLPRDAAQIGSFMWHVKFAAKLERYVQNKTIEELANIFVDPRSVELLEQLAKINPASEQAQSIVRRILYVTNNLKTEEERAREQQMLREQSIPQ